MVASLGAPAALAVNAATFVVSAALAGTLSATSANEVQEDAPIGIEGVRVGLRIWRTTRCVTAPC